MPTRPILEVVLDLVAAGGLWLCFDPPVQAGAVTTDAGTWPDRRPVLGATRRVFVESVTVRADSISGTTTFGVLDASRRYALRASGLWTNAVGPRDDFLVDAEYSVVAGTVRDGHPPDPEDLDGNWGDLRIDGQFVDWGEYSANHVYWLELPGTGAAARFDVYDGDRAGRRPPSWYADNSGSLVVEIYEMPEIVADCVCPSARRRLPPVVIADALAQPERYRGWMDLQDPGKPASPANPPRTCLTLRHVNLDYHPLWNVPVWKAICP